MNKIVLRSASLILAFILTFGIFTSGRATSQSAVLMPNKLINLAFFYKPPSNSDAATVASNFSNVILTGGDESFRDQLVVAGFASSILQYYRSDGIQDPGSCTASPSNNQIAYKTGDFCDISKNHPDWFLLDTSGNRMPTSPGSSYYRMDPGNEGWRNFFVTRLLEIDQQKGWSGVFLDNVEASLAEIQRDGLTPAKYPDNASYQAAVNGFLQYLHQNYAQPYNRPVMANIIARSDEAQWFNYMPSLDGAMQERWAVPWSSTTGYLSETKWSSDMALAEKTQAQGKFILLVAQGSKTDTARQNFAFASYLLVSNGYASFRYTDSSIYKEVWLYDNYKVQLGTPLGARYQTGTAWRRDFTNGSVIVDPVNHTANISVSPVASPTSTKAPTLAVTNTPTLVPTLSAAYTATQAPTLAATSTQASTLVPTSAAAELPTSTAAAATTAIVYNDQSSTFVYSSNWKDVVDSQAYQGEYQLTKVIGSSVTLTFTGQSFTVIYKAGPLLGKMDVYIDSKLIGTLNEYASSPTYQKKWKYSGTLATGSHKLKLVLVGPTNARGSVDGVSIP